MADADLNQLNDSLSRLLSGLDKISGATNALSKSLGAIGTVATQAGTQLGVFTAPLNAAGAALGTLGTLVGGPVGAAFEAVGQVAGAAASAFERVVSVMGEFAAVAAPAVMIAFNKSLQDLKATIGTAFTPFFQSLVNITRQIAGELYPAMQQLRPVFQAAANILGAVLVPIFRTIGQVLQAITPALKVWEILIGAMVGVFNPFISLLQMALAPIEAFNTLFLAIVQGLQPVFDLLHEFGRDLQFIADILTSIFKAAIMTVVDALKALLPAFDLKDAMKFLRDVTLQAAKALLVFAVQVSKLFGNNTFAANLIKALEGLQNNKPFAVAPPQNVQETSLDAIQKQLEVSAAGAVGALEPEKKIDDIYDQVQDLIAAVKEADKGQNAVLGGLAKTLTEARNYLEKIEGEVDSLKGIVAGTTQKAGEKIEAAYDHAKEGAGLAFRYLNPLNAVQDLVNKRR